MNLLELLSNLHDSVCPSLSWEIRKHLELEASRILLARSLETAREAEAKRVGRKTPDTSSLGVCRSWAVQDEPDAISGGHR